MCNGYQCSVVDLQQLADVEAGQVGEAGQRSDEEGAADAAALVQVEVLQGGRQCWEV